MGVTTYFNATGGATNASRLRLLLLCLTATIQLVHAEVTCPPMPAAVTTANRDVKFGNDLEAGSIAKVKAADVGLKNDASAKTLVEKAPERRQIACSADARSNLLSDDIQCCHVHHS